MPRMTVLLLALLMAEGGAGAAPLLEKGERLFNVLLERLIATCREYHEMEPPQYREFGSHCP